MDERFAETPDDYLFEPTEEGQVASLPAPELEADSEKPTECDDMNLRDEVVELLKDRGWTWFKDKLGKTYADIPSKKGSETVPIDSEAMRRQIRNLYHEVSGRGLSAGVVKDVCDTLDALASCAEIQYEVHVRIAHHDNAIYCDLCNDAREIIKVDATGWGIIHTAPVKFLRPQGMLPLSEPARGGSIEQLRPLINAREDSTWRAIVIFILSSYSKGAFPALAVTGEQGSAKTSLSHAIRELLDPSDAPSSSAPREPRDIMCTAVNSHVLCLDNLSKIPENVSDALCRISTGSSIRERRYHTNDGAEVLLKAKRPIIFNGIDFRMRGDLLDRSLLINLSQIPDDERRDEAELQEAFNSQKPEILGGIFDILVEILRNLLNTKLERKPRMADSALWVTAAETALGWESGTVINHFDNNRAIASESAIESDAFISALVEHLKESGQSNLVMNWKDLTALGPDTKDRKNWPKDGKDVAGRLRRSAPALKAAGFEYASKKAKSRFYEFAMIDNLPSNASTCLELTENLTGQESSPEAGQTAEESNPSNETSEFAVEDAEQ